MKIIVEKEEYERLIQENIELKQQVTELIKENKALKDQISVLMNENIELKAQLQEALEQIKLLSNKLFGKSSEKADLPDDTVNEAEALNDINEDPEEEPDYEKIIYIRKKKCKKRNKIFEDIPVEVIEYYLTNDDCPNCPEGKLHIMKKIIRRELLYKPAEFKALEHVIAVYCCRNCYENEENATIIKADSPVALIPKSVASASLVAYIMYEKYVMASPLNRIEKHFDGFDIQLSRQVMATWVIKVANNHLVKIYDAMKALILEKEIIFSDDTGIQVLKEEGRLATTQSYMWVYISVVEEEIYLFEYTKTRARAHPKAFLEGFSGFLQVDGYAGYEKIDGIILIGCFSHARRYFFEAVSSLPKAKRTKEVASVIGFNYCNQLFKTENEIIEKIIGEFGDDYDVNKKEVHEKVFELRKKLSQPILDEFKSWLDSIEPTVAPKSLLGKAVNYCLNQWPKLIGFMLDGKLELSNNRSERTIRNFVTGRKNWLFADTPSGATSSAIIYSIAETAKANNLSVYKYFEYILKYLPNIKDENVSKLLPWSKDLPDDIKIQSTKQNE
jgi:transposase